MSIFLFGREYKIAEINGPIILTEEEAKLEEMRNDMIRDEFDREVIDRYARYDLSNSNIWEYAGTYEIKNGKIGNRRLFGIISQVDQYRTWKKYVAKTTGKVVYRPCEVSEFCLLDDIV